MHAIGYVRVSTDEQADRGVSLDAQRAKIEAYAALKEMTLAEIVEDAGLSAKNTRRPGLQRVLQLARTRAVDAVIVLKLDRMFRNTVDAIDTTRALEKWGVTFHSIQETVDTKSATGRFFFTLLAAIGEMERGVISERTRAALRFKRNAGQKTGGDVPYGFTEKGGFLIPNPDEQEAIALMRELRAAGNTFRDIAEELERHGYHTRRGADHWHPQSVKRILERAAA